MPADRVHTAVLPDETANAERRRETRYPTHDIAEVEILPGPNPSMAAWVLDVSRDGLHLQLNSALAKGAQLKVRLRPDTIVFGQVRYCRRSNASFHVGVLIQDVFRSPDKQPGHATEDALVLYRRGKGLSAREVIRLKDHLLHCEFCRIRLLETGNANATSRGA